MSVKKIKTNDSQIGSDSKDSQKLNYTYVYTDGACKNNQNQKIAIAGVGVWFGKDDPRNLSESLDGKVQTNNRAELMALIRAIEIMFNTEHVKTRNETKRERDERDPSEILILCTDSQYCKNGIEKWINGWKKNGWKTANKKPVKNKDLWLRLDCLRNDKPIEFKWVEGHAGITGNEEADKLAVSGCYKKNNTN